MNKESENPTLIQMWKEIAILLDSLILAPRITKLVTIDSRNPAEVCQAECLQEYELSSSCSYDQSFLGQKLFRIIEGNPT